MPLFHKFQQLPTELREVIWKLCLPYRVRELDIPSDEVIYGLYDGPTLPCSLSSTSRINAKPPVIAHVCQEARSICFTKRSHLKDFLIDRPATVAWSSGTSLDFGWQDQLRDTPHLHWNKTYTADFSESGDALACLTWEGKASSNKASITDDLWQGLDGDSVTNALKLFTQLDKWFVIMDMYIVHTTVESSGGWFGLLGDASVQIVDVRETHTINALFDMAQSCEAQYDCTAPQSFELLSAGHYERLVRFEISQRLRSEVSEEVWSRMRPAIMFRLCTQFCSRRGES